MEDEINWEVIYEERMREAMAEEALYPSSPELTIVEYITAVTSQQKMSILKPDFNMEEYIAALAGFRSRHQEIMRIWAGVEGEYSGFILPANQKFKLGELCFENERPREIWRGNITDIHLEDSCVYLVFDGVPVMEKEIIVYVKCSVQDGLIRKIQWEFLGDGRGYSIEARDSTRGFTRDGEISFNLEDIALQSVKLDFMDRPGYVICGVITNYNSNEEPVIRDVKGAVFPLVQRETLSCEFVFEAGDECYIYSDIMEEQLIKVYGKREGDKGYCMLERGCYDVVRQGFGQYYYKFNENFERVRIFAFSKAVADSYEIGIIYGYEGESFELPFKNIIKDKFSVLVESILPEGGIIFDIVEPKSFGSGGLLYDIDEKKGEIKIIDSGNCTGAKIYIGSLAINYGNEIVVTAGSELWPVGYSSDVKFLCAADKLYDGREESFEEVKKRFIKDVYTSSVAVTPEDYEKIVKGLPSVGVDIVKAWADRKKNQVNIAVYVKGMEKGRKISDYAKKIIMEELDRRRIISTKIALVNPVFVKVNVKASVVVRAAPDKIKDKLREIIVSSIDYIKSGRDFGETLLFEEVYGRIAGLKWVDRVNIFTMHPENYVYVSAEGANIKPDNNCLLLSGVINLEILKTI